MIVQIPLVATPAQDMAVLLGAQSCRLSVYQKAFGLFVDLYVSDRLIIGGVVAENRNRIVRSVYLGFAGDLYFNDTQGLADPDYTGLADRFQLWWNSALS